MDGKMENTPSQKGYFSAIDGMVMYLPSEKTHREYLRVTCSNWEIAECLLWLANANLVKGNGFLVDLI